MIILQAKDLYLDMNRKQSDELICVDNVATKMFIVVWLNNNNEPLTSFSEKKQSTVNIQLEDLT